MKLYFIYSVFCILSLSKLVSSSGDNLSSASLYNENSISEEEFKCHNYQDAYFIYDTFYIGSNNENNGNKLQEIEVNKCIENSKKPGEYISINQFKKPNHYYILLSNFDNCTEPYEFDFLNCSPFDLLDVNQERPNTESDGSQFVFKYGISNKEVLAVEQTKQKLSKCSELPIQPDDLFLPFYIPFNDTESEELW
ncbi:hypothetical protein DICPUDRAFT_159219 [Dictyostelium purpureum]|uniref:Uncharacterized protein n=1 Tax=Dictyostelium purpureum TaxID=5786 RepID=F1A3K5_DICPU|nr:uncharacterized protein DICPUDRAFT_159219 [Dictyostelium purpureum]EGC29224.1 hypothetical protein DICPUDRAFT_159219 [Dictyostelium purpureum]|eukprot:XP_003294246.1 hypothetical protein DICPUDRAFT_159219 [Dictyostelium purpureum]